MTNTITCKKCSSTLTLKTHLKNEMCGKCIYVEYKEYINRDPEKKKRWTKKRNDNFYSDPTKKARKLAYVKRWMKENNERWNEYSKKWCRENRDKRNLYARRAYWKKKGILI